MKYKFVHSITFTLGLISGLYLQSYLKTHNHLTAHEIVQYTPNKEAYFQLPIIGQVLHRDGYTLLYDARNKNPYCVIEVLTKDSLQGSADHNKRYLKLQPISRCIKTIFFLYYLLR